MEKKVATQVIHKYLRKGNMARCLRDILPAAGLSLAQREEVADIVHSVVRWKSLYDQVIHSRGLPRSASTYVDLALEDAQKDAAAYPFEVRYSCSLYVAALLADHEDWAAFLNQTPPSTLCVNFNRSTSEEVISLLRQEKLSADHAVLQSALFSTSSSKYSKVIQRYFAHVQDESSQLVSYLAASYGESIFDYCAGNGGKSLAIASMTTNTKRLSAYVPNESKRATLRRRCEQYDAKVNVVDRPQHDQYDLVLVDAPCTGLGAARRNPEIKYIENAGSLPDTQLSILTQAADSLKSDGILFYAVCTITPEETTQVIQTFLETNTFALSSLEEASYTEFLMKNRFGAFTRFPRGDLFFISMLQKEG